MFGDPARNAFVDLRLEWHRKKAQVSIEFDFAIATDEFRSEKLRFHFEHFLCVAFREFKIADAQLIEKGRDLFRNDPIDIARLPTRNADLLLVLWHVLTVYHCHLLGKAESRLADSGRRF